MNENVRRYREAARRVFHDEGTIEVEDGARVSPSEGGAYVQAWVWVSDEEVD